MLLTFFLVVIGWIIFRAESIGEAWEYFCRVFSSSIFSLPSLRPFRNVLPATAGIVFVLFTEWVQRFRQHGLQADVRHPVRTGVLTFIVFLSVFAAAVSQEGSSAFIYFQF